MAAGLITVGHEFGGQIGIEKYSIYIGSVYIRVTEDTIRLGAQAAMLSAVQRGKCMTLEAKPISRLSKKPFIGGTVRLMTFDTSAAIHQIIQRHWMFMYKRARFLRVAVLTGPIDPPCEHRILYRAQMMAVDATNISIFKRMHCSALEFGHYRRMAGRAEIGAVVFDQFRIMVAVNCMA